MTKTKCAIIGTGNIGTDLMIKILRRSESLELVAFVGIDPESDGIARAKRLGVPTISSGVDGLIESPDFNDIRIVFDATSAKAHLVHETKLRPFGKKLIDLTPAAVGPYVVPVANLDAHLDADNVNMVTCGGQATIPIVVAVSESSKVLYAEIVASIASKSAGPGTRANIDEFTETTSHGIEVVGQAEHGKAIIILNPADPPLLMRDTVYTFTGPDSDEDAIRDSIEKMVSKVNEYVPGYRLKQAVQFERFGDNNPVRLPGIGLSAGLKTSVFLEVEGAGHYLPKYAGNLDIMTSAALATAERMAARQHAEKAM